MRTCLLLLACVSAGAAAANAQEPDEDPVDTARVQLGPLGLTPSIALANLGVDTNVFNTYEDPKQDFTLTLSPAAELWLRAGPSRLSVASRLDAVYFRRYASERSLDGEVDGRWEVRWNRLTPWIAGGYARGRQRVGYEIDVRSRRTVTDVAAGVEARVASKTRIVASAHRSTYEHDAEAVFFDASLQEVLNRETEAWGLQYRQALTPLTTFVVHGEVLTDTFAFSPQRDSDGVRVQAGFDLDTRALIAGTGRVGYRRFESVGGGLPDFTGVVASYGVEMVIGGRTHMEIVGERDVTYSYDLVYPYFVLSGATITLTPRMAERWDLQARAGGQWLAYRAARAFAGVPERTDEFVLLGGGVGIHIGRRARIGFNVNHERRRSPLEARDYRGFRFGTSVTYGR